METQSPQRDIRRGKGLRGWLGTHTPQVLHPTPPLPMWDPGELNATPSRDRLVLPDPQGVGGGGLLWEPHLSDPSCSCRVWVQASPGVQQRPEKRGERNAQERPCPTPVARVPGCSAGVQGAFLCGLHRHKELPTQLLDVLTK